MQEDDRQEIMEKRPSLSKPSLAEGEIAELRDFFKKQEGVKLAYLFGSSAKGERGKSSDVDIAVLLDECLSRKDRLNLELALIGELTSLLKTNSLDLVVMHNIPLLLSYNIVKYGVLLKSGPERIKTEAGILSRYLDRKYYMQRHARETIKMIARVGLR
jgi:predicted nucleotidyltransferase